MPSHWLTSLGVGGVSFGQRPFEVQLAPPAPVLEQPQTTQRARAAVWVQIRDRMLAMLPDEPARVSAVSIKGEAAGPHPWAGARICSLGGTAPEWESPKRRCRPRC